MGPKTLSPCSRRRGARRPGHRVLETRRAPRSHPPVISSERAVGAGASDGPSPPPSGRSRRSSRRSPPEAPYPYHPLRPASLLCGFSRNDEPTDASQLVHFLESALPCSRPPSGEDLPGPRGSGERAGHTPEPCPRRPTSSSGARWGGRPPYAGNRRISGSPPEAPACPLTPRRACRTALVTTMEHLHHHHRERRSRLTRRSDESAGRAGETRSAIRLVSSRFIVHHPL